MFGVKKNVKVINTAVFLIFILTISLILAGCSVFERTGSSGTNNGGDSEEGVSFSGSYIEFTGLDEGNAGPGEKIGIDVTVINSGNKDAGDVRINLLTSELLEPGDEQTFWNIDVLKKGEEKTFNTNLTLMEGISRGTRVEIKLEISSDEVDSFISQGYSLTVCDTGKFKGDFIPIIGMHAIEDHIEDPIELYTGHFDKLCSVLKEYGYETITLRDLLDYMDSGKELPEKPVIITSDDGFQDVYINGLPILKKYGYKMTVFLVTGAVGEDESERKTNEYFEKGSGYGSPTRPLLIWPEIEEMYEYGCEFQSHTVNHVRLGLASDEDVLYELKQSKEDIESHLGNEVMFVALPKGNYNPDKEPLFEKAGYRGALRHAGGAEDLSTIDLYSIKRVEFNSLISPDRYAGFLELDRSIKIDYEIDGCVKDKGEKFTVEFSIENTGEDSARITSMELELPDNIKLAGVSPDGYVNQYPGVADGVYMWVSDSYVIDGGGRINLIAELEGDSAGQSVVKFRVTYNDSYINCDDIEVEIE